MSTADTEKRSLSPSASVSDRDAKRKKESTESPKIEFKVKLKKDYELDWVQNLIVTAQVISSEDAGAAQSEAKRDDDKVNVCEVAATEKTSAETVHDKENVSDDEDQSIESEPEWEEETFSDGNDYFGDEDNESEDEPNAIGYVEARIIRRRAIRREYWSEMEMPSQDTSQLAFELFDRYGYLRKEYITGRNRGSGVWGEEVGSWDILQVETVRVNPEWRRQGIATTMLEKAIEKAREVKHVGFALAWPSYLSHCIPHNLPEEEHKKRRYEGYDTATALFRKAGYRRVGSSVWFCLSLDPSHPSHNIKPDEDYDPPEGEGSDSRTELEKFEDKLEAWRTKRGDRWICVDMSDNFRGFHNEDVKKLVQLHNLPGPLAPLTLARAKYGCNCGQCIAGFLSPRMHYTLLAQAEIHHDSTNDELEDCLPGLTADERMEWSMLGLMNQYLLNHIATSLRAKHLPTVPKILRAAEQASEWPPHVKNYLQRGGTVDAVLRGLLDICINQDDKAGDGSFYDIFEKDIDKLPECRNDHEFGFVLGMLLGLPGNSARAEEAERCLLQGNR